MHFLSVFRFMKGINKRMFNMFFLIIIYVKIDSNKAMRSVMYDCLHRSRRRIFISSFQKFQLWVENYYYYKYALTRAQSKNLLILQTSDTSQNCLYRWVFQIFIYKKYFSNWYSKLVRKMQSKSRTEVSIEKTKSTSINSKINIRSTTTTQNTIRRYSDCNIVFLEDVQRKNYEGQRMKLLKRKEELIQEFKKKYIMKRPGVQEIKFKDGSTYTGGLNQHKQVRQGKGILRCANGQMYIGDFGQSLFEGEGIYFFKSGTIYEGSFKNHLRYGFGKEYSANGNYYQGNFVNQLREGQGFTSYFTTGEKYEGNWKENNKHGYGTYTYAYGCKYEGDWVCDKREGRAKFTFTDGTIYEGDFKSDKMQGKGLLIYPNGDRYQGYFIDGCKHGQGIIAYSNGDNYTGMFVDDAMCGSGKYSFSNGDYYQGQFQSGHPHGCGKYFYLGGHYYEGQWLYGKKKGQGVLHSFKDTYKGQWANNMKMGVGQYTWQNGDRYQGGFINDFRQGKGRYYWVKGEEVVGWWLKDILNGNGVFYDKGQQHDIPFLNGFINGY